MIVTVRDKETGKVLAVIVVKGEEELSVQQVNDAVVDIE
jgi:hypothetical protein